MKRIVKILIFLMLVMASFNISFGNSSIPQVNIQVDGKSMSVPQSSLKLDGNMLATVVPPIIMGSRTLVPIRFIESLGAQVEWDNATQTATVAHNATIVSMRINSDSVTVNGQKMKLDENSIPKLVTFTSLKDSRTMVPVRFVSQVLGYSVNWDPASYTALIDSPAPPAPSGDATITEIEAIMGSTGKYRIKITSDMPLKYEHMYLDSSGKLVLDFPDARINIPERLDTPGDIALDDELITRVQYSQFTIPPNPYTARVVLTLSQNAQFSFVTADEGKTSYVAFDENQVSGIFTDREDGRDFILVEGATTADYNIIELKNPTRVVIDIMDASLNGAQYQTFDFNLGFVKSVRASQFVADNNYSTDDRIVRVVLDAKDGIENPKVLIVPSEKGLQIYPEENIWDAFSYQNLGNQAKLSFTHLDDVEAELDYDEVRKELKIEIPTRDTELPEGSFIIKDNLVNEVTVTRGRTRTEITVSFRRSVEIEVLSDDEDEILEILAVRNDDISQGERTIVIDAGHGGKDPGAISLNGFHEKEISLSMAIQLQQKLIEQGYNVIMTRTDDTFVELYSRARLANEMNADLFISMHANSNINSSILGLEVLYCPATSSELKLEDQFPFADRIYASILNSTRTPGRGVFKRPELVVLRETIMPAVIIEIGYLSNLQEESMVRDPGYQALVVQGILDGVNQYLSEY